MAKPKPSPRKGKLTEGKRSSSQGARESAHTEDAEPLARRELIKSANRNPVENNMRRNPNKSKSEAL